MIQNSLWPPTKVAGPVAAGQIAKRLIASGSPISLRPTKSKEVEVFRTYLQDDVSVYYDETETGYLNYLLMSSVRSIAEHPSRSRLLLTVLERQSPVGIICATLKTDCRVKIGPMFIKRLRRGRGLGTYVIQTIEEAFADAGYSTIYLTTPSTNIRMIRFVTRLDYVASAKLFRHYSPVHDEISYEKRLAVFPPYLTPVDADSMPPGVMMAISKRSFHHGLQCRESNDHHLLRFLTGCTNGYQGRPTVRYFWRSRDQIQPAARAFYKRGGSVRVEMIAEDSRIMEPTLAALEANAREQGRRKIFAILPSQDSAYRMLESMRYRKEGSISFFGTDSKFFTIMSKTQL